MRAQAEWNVMTHIARARFPTSASTRSRISCAALLVNVMARISPGRACPVPTRWAIRCVSTRVLPEPAPARMSRGPSPCSTASRWGSFRPASSWSVATAATEIEDSPVRGGDPVGEQRGQAVLRAILAFAIVSTAMHYSHKFIELESYPGAGGGDGIRPAILLSWPLLTAIGLYGYRLHSRGRLEPAYACLLSYALLGLTTPGHFLDGSPDIAPF